MSPTEEWLPVCRMAELEVERGASALVHGHPMAIFRTADDTVYAIGNHDPFDRTNLLSKGIVGTREGVPFVGSPRHRHSFDLRTGQCLDDEHMSVPSYDVQVLEGVVLVGRRREAEVS
jgi:nitrite reductase (NADH) small subunit